MSRLKLVALLFLAACAAPSSHIAGFRSPKTEIYSSAAFDVSRVEGRWTQVAAFSAGDNPGCKPGGVEFRKGATGPEIAAQLCLNGRIVQAQGPLRMVGPGRMAVPGMQDWWVIWVDSGYRTLAIGTPDGSFGFLLDREKISGDRLHAAAEVFDFNGYSKARFKAY
ncbi:lipocalin [Xinfangfangia sp. CPCC 101601]|uniref:Lipocalin n=1 Tax=Pseudogemmobacter lacusdianii TaxID=3069608 RepID=A0ABU0VV96_9RHOB|nr:lipocalin [Xinfangfangia sp. CPCC 101601]MDQ2065661.1 lipocalin [Xinfangfangia sp. CPCC 101601]